MIREVGRVSIAQTKVAEGDQRRTKYAYKRALFLFHCPRWLTIDISTTYRVYLSTDIFSLPFFPSLSLSFWSC